MQQTIRAEFENFDTAEAAAFAVKKQLHSAEIITVRPDHPESLRLTFSHPTRFTLLPTAVLSQNYITALIETEYNYENLNEIQKRQTTAVQIVCNTESVEKAHGILTAHGGRILPPS